MASPIGVSNIPVKELQKLSKRATGLSIFLSILLMIGGFIALGLPFAMSIGVVILSAWMMIIGGVVQFVHAFSCEGIGHKLWRMGVAALYLFTGFFLRANIGIGLLTLTLLLSAFFVVQGIMDIAAYFATRKSGVSGWRVFDGIVILLLGLIISRQWPASSLWLVGTLVGINMIVTGFTRLMLTLAVRRAMKAVKQVAEVTVTKMAA